MTTNDGLVIRAASAQVVFTFAGGLSQSAGHRWTTRCEKKATHTLRRIGDPGPSTADIAPEDKKDDRHLATTPKE